MTNKTSKLVAYNRAVLNRLRETNPTVAEQLNARGQSLGWWNIVRHCASTGSPVEVTANVIVARSNFVETLSWTEVETSCN